MLFDNIDYSSIFDDSADKDLDRSRLIALLNNTWKNLHPKFKKELNTHTRAYILSGGRWSGKTHFMSDIIILYSFFVKENVLIGREYKTQVEFGIFNQLLDNIANGGYSDYFESKNNLLINKVNGRHITCQGLRETKGSNGDFITSKASLDRIKTFNKYGLCVFDESASATSDTISTLEKTLRPHPYKLPYFFFAYNPIDFIDPVKEYYQNKSHAKHIHSTIFDLPEHVKNTPACKQALIDAENDKINKPYSYNHEWLGLPKVMQSGLPFKNIEITNKPLQSLSFDCCHIDPARDGSDSTALTLLFKDGFNYVALGKMYKNAWYDVFDEMITEILKYDNNPLVFFEKNITGNQPQTDSYFGKYQNVYEELYTSVSNKHNRILKLEGAVNTKEIKLHEQSDEMYIKEVRNYNENAQHDDAPDSLSACYIGALFGVKELKKR